jgi:YD repeat-containing protein
MKRKLLILAALVAMAAADGFAQEPKDYNWFRIAHAGNWSRILFDQYVGVESVVIRNYHAKDFFGKLVKVGEPYTAVLSFDDRDKMVKNTTYYDGKMDDVIVYKYDEAGRHVESSWYNPNGDMEERYLYDYDSEGNKVTEDVCDGKGSLMHGSIYEYDSEGKIVAGVYYGSKNQVFETYKYEYNDEGNLTRYTLDRSSDTWVHLYSYDSDGMLVEEVCYDDGVVEERKCYKYDTDGNVVEMILYDSNGLVKESYVCKHDPKGNEVECVAYKTVAKIPFLFVEIEITYR